MLGKTFFALITSLSLHWPTVCGDLSGCCTHLHFHTRSRTTVKEQSQRLGNYSLTGLYNDRPVYKHTSRDEFIYYVTKGTRGLWLVGPKVGAHHGGLAHRDDNLCVESLTEKHWKYSEKSAKWQVDPQLKLSCLDTKVTPSCVYSGGIKFVGGDLPKQFGGGGLVTDSESPANCIAECDKRQGCLYWTWVRRRGVNCYLKRDMGRRSERASKHVSGSIPSACYEPEKKNDDDVPELQVEREVVDVYEMQQLKLACTYKGIDFVGGDLYHLDAVDVDECRQRCLEELECKLFTFTDTPETRSTCYLKTEAALARVDDLVVSGAGIEICEEFIAVLDE